MIRYGKVVGSGPPWPVRISGDPAADILVDFQFGLAFVEGDFVVCLQLASGAWTACKMARSL